MSLIAQGAFLRDRGTDLLVSAGLLALAIYVHSAAGRFSELGAIFPRAVALMIAALGVGLLLSVLLPRGSIRSKWSQWRHGRVSRESDALVVPVTDDAAALRVASAADMAAATTVDSAEDAVTSPALPAYSVIAGLILWVGLMPEIGFVAASTLGLIAFSLAILERERWTRRNITVLVLFSAITPALIHFVMSEYLLVPLP